MPLQSVPGGRGLRAAACLLFFFSGGAGLIYQSIWSQYLGLFMGHAAYAQCLVLAIFMGGMALGAWLASRAAGRSYNLLRLYAWAELAIGLAAAGFHHEFLAVTGFAYDRLFPALNSPWLADAGKWLLGAGLILPQSALLGATFPLMSNALARRQRAADGHVISLLYFTNSMGAAMGALLSTFVLLPAVGLPGAIRCGGLLSVAVGLCAFLLSRGGEQPLGQPRLAYGARNERPGAARLLVAAAFVTGATSFVYEIGWVRMLSLALGTTLHAFELMLSAFIGGLALGGWWIRKRIDGYAEPVRVAGWVQVLMGLAALASLLLYASAFDWVAWLMGALQHNAHGYAVFNVLSAAISVAIMAPAAFFAGQTLPLFTLALIRARGGEASVGRIYAADTLGAIAGVFAAVQLLIPALGLKLAMTAAAVGDIVLGLVLLRQAAQGRPRVALASALLLSAAAAVALTLRLADFDTSRMASGVYRSGSASLAHTIRVAYYRDGKTASISVTESPSGLRSIATNGKPDAAMVMRGDAPAGADEPTMVMLGLMPLVLHPDPRLVAVIGFGSGLTTHTLLGDSRVQHVDTIEIEPAVYEGAKAFRPLVERAYTDPRSQVHFDDAKTYFTSTRAQYDVIVSEPSNPWVSGVGGLFSQEFYRFATRHLRPGGLLVQWVQLYEIDDELAASVVNALKGSFQDFSIYQAATTDAIIVARVDGKLPEPDEKVLAQAGLHPWLDRIGIKSAEDLRLHRIGDRALLEPFFAAEGVRVNSDFHPVLSLEAPRTRFESASADDLIGLSSADLPLLEMLGRGAPFSSAAIQKTWTLLRSSMQDHAGVISQALAGAPATFDADDASTAADTALARGIGACTAGLTPAAAVDSLVALAGKTIPLLPPEELQKSWIQPAWVSCAALPPVLADTLAVFSALARRDAAGTETAARHVLDSERSQVSNSAADYLVRAAMLGDIAAGKPDEALRVFENYGSTLPPVTRQRWQMQYLLRYAIAQAPHPPG